MSQYNNRSNFHEDDLRHYHLKAQNAREDGHKVGYDGYRRASKATIQDLLDSPGLNLAVRRKLMTASGQKDPVAEILAKLSPEKAELLRKLLG